jgi:hypothetical protein
MMEGHRPAYPTLICYCKEGSKFAHQHERPGRSIDSNNSESIVISSPSCTRLKAGRQIHVSQALVVETFQRCHSITATQLRCLSSNALREVAHVLQICGPLYSLVKHKYEPDRDKTTRPDASIVHLDLVKSRRTPSPSLASSLTGCTDVRCRSMHFSLAVHVRPSPCMVTRGKGKAYHDPPSRALPGLFRNNQ